jgi:DNA repair exonuclease SbcCD nuclease subunit
MKKPSAILTSDWHLRETTPTCRTDDFWKAQWDKVDWIAELQKQYDCPVLHAGDLFHHWKPSPFLLSATIKHLPDKFVTIYGQHDLPQHSLELKEKSGIYVLEKAGKLRVLDEASWGQKPDKGSYFLPVTERHILVWHKFTYIGKDPWPGITSPKENELLKKYPQFDLILTGDNHQPFVVEWKGRLLVNPGCLTRQRASETHEPRIYLWYAEQNQVEKVIVPHIKEAVTNEHIEVKKERDERMDAFIDSLEMEWDEELNFEENVKQFFNRNRVRKCVKEIILKAMDDK